MKIFDKKSVKFVLLAIIFIIFFTLVFLGSKNDNKNRTEQFFVRFIDSQAVFSVEVAKEKAERVKGLSGREALLKGEGMLFVFEVSDRHGFWMKDMKFPLDIIWIDDNKRVVHIEESVDPNTYPKTFYPEQDSRYVLEIGAGLSAINDIKVGQYVSFEENI